MYNEGCMLIPKICRVVNTEVGDHTLKIQESLKHRVDTSPGTLSSTIPVSYSIPNGALKKSDFLRVLLHTLLESMIPREFTILAPDWG